MVKIGVRTFTGVTDMAGGFRCLVAILALLCATRGDNITFLTCSRSASTGCSSSGKPDRMVGGDCLLRWMPSENYIINYALF
jgi:hypothetical protein